MTPLPCPYCGDTGWIALEAELQTNLENLWQGWPTSVLIHQTYCVCLIGRDLADRAGATDPESPDDTQDTPCQP